MFFQKKNAQRLQVHSKTLQAIQFKAKTAEKKIKGKLYSFKMKLFFTD